MENKKNIRIEEVADVNFEYPYLEVFYLDAPKPFLEICINSEKTLNFKFYSNLQEINLVEGEMEYISNTAKKFFLESLKNEDYFQKSYLDIGKLSTPIQ